MHLLRVSSSRPRGGFFVSGPPTQKLPVVLLGRSFSSLVTRDRIFKGETVDSEGISVAGTGSKNCHQSHKPAATAEDLKRCKTLKDLSIILEGLKSTSEGLTRTDLIVPLAVEVLYLSRAGSITPSQISHATDDEDNVAGAVRRYIEDRVISWLSSPPRPLGLHLSAIPEALKVLGCSESTYQRVGTRHTFLLNCRSESVRRMLACTYCMHGITGSIPEHVVYKSYDCIYRYI